MLTVRASVFKFLANRRKRGGSSQEVADYVKKPCCDIRPRITELKKAGKVQYSGRTTYNLKTRRNVKVWVIT
jgi:hypothetical protein